VAVRGERRRLRLDPLDGRHARAAARRLAPTGPLTLDADALPRIINELRARGYDFVTVEEAILAELSR
jgi:peptidoglycan/xylan/chitin deacetylase (PgdA/CDA1 family)